MWIVPVTMPKIGDRYYYRRNGNETYITNITNVMANGRYVTLYWFGNIGYDLDRLNQYFSQKHPDESLKVWAKENGFLWKD